MSKKLIAVLGLLVIASMLLVACGGNDTPTNEVVNEPTVNEPADDTTTEPDEEAAPPRVGGWVDTIALSVVGADAAVTQIEAGAIDIYGSNLGTPQDLEAIEAAGLETSFQYGIYYELSFNPAGDPTFANDPTKLNPFSSDKIREAMNWLVDRDYINQEVYGGNAVNKWVSFVSGFPEYGRYIDLIRPYEVKYAPNRDQAVAVITEEMEAMGAEMVDGKWTFGGEPVEIVFLIRTDSDGTRKPMGDIISVWLEEVGFTVTPQYGTSSELSAIWASGNVDDGVWNIYTGAWGSGVVSRDDTYDFEFFYSPRSIYGGTTLWQAYDLTEEEADVMTALANKEYTNSQERRDLIEQGLDIAFRKSFRVWVADGRAVSPWKPEISVSYDLSAGVDINALYPFTMKYDDAEGGVIRMGEPDLYVDPPNPVQGSNWTYDSVWQLPTADFDTITNPHTGVPLPQRLERAEVVVKSGLPVVQTYDWVSLEFADEIVPPDDAWVYWDVETETFLTVADWKATVATVDAIEAAVADAAAGVDFAALDVDGVVATMEAVAGLYTDLSGKAIDFAGLIADGTAVPEPVEGEEAEEVDPRPLIQIRLEDDILAADDPAVALTDYAMEWLETADAAGLFAFASRDLSTANTKVTYYYPENTFDIVWHDGSPLTVGDFVMQMIEPYATGLPGSPIYDPSSAQSLTSSLASAKGERIISTDPLVIESYSDTWYEDAEYNAVPGRYAYWPDYGYGESAWSMIAVANKAEEALELAFSADKADANEIEWMSWIGGPSLEILAAKLDEAIAENYIPFEPTMGQYVTAEEAAAKYANLKDFYGEYGHFWSGTGPYILTDVRLVEKTATLSHNPNYIDLAGKWDQFAEPKVADIAVDGAGRVTIGEEATFDVFVTFKGENYPADEITEVKYLLFNAANEIVATGNAEFVSEGQYLVTLSSDITGALESGANKLEVVAVAIPVSIPAIGAFEFVSE
jgi:hypothetical protein